MVTSVHLLASAAIGHATGDVYIASVLAFSVHYLLDATPHWCWKPVKNYKEGGWRKADKIDFFIKATEPVAGITLTLFLASLAPSELVLPMILGAFFGWLPDLLVFLEWKFKINRSSIIKKFEAKYHRHAYSFSGILPQLLVVLIIGCYFFFALS